jgi:hypothetical protein
MARPNPWRHFTPRPEQAALRPEVSGNSINGLGEKARRRPRHVYWATDPDQIPHGAMQRWFYANDPDNPHILKARAERQKILDAPLGPVEGAPVERSPEDWTRALQDFATTADFEMVGVAEMNPDWVFEGAEVREARIVMIGVAHDYDAIAAAPEAPAGAEVVRQYGRAAGASKAVAGWLRAQGWPAEPVTGPMSGRLTMIPAALASGFGELGKHGSIINAEYGASFRLAAVLTDAPLAPTPPPRPRRAISGWTISVQAAASAKTPARPRRSCPTSNSCGGSGNGTSISTSASRSSMNISAAPSASPSVPGAAPASG